MRAVLVACAALVGCGAAANDPAVVEGRYVGRSEQVITDCSGVAMKPLIGDRAVVAIEADITAPGTFIVNLTFSNATFKPAVILGGGDITVDADGQRLLRGTVIDGQLRFASTGRHVSVLKSGICEEKIDTTFSGQWTAPLAGGQ